VAVTKEITRLEKSTVKMSFTVPKDEVRAKYQEMLKEYTKELQLPGFRKGKVPQEVLERKYADALKQDALSRIMESALQDAFKDETLKRSEKPLPYSLPEIKDEPKLDFEQDLQFSVVYDSLPEVKIGQWKGLTLEVPYTQVEDGDINRELEEIRERNAIVMDRDDDAAAQNNDVVTIDYQIFGEDGEALPEFQRKDFAFTLGSNSVFQFDNDIIGMKKGETKEFEKLFADDFLESTLAGKKRKAQITLTALKEKKLPDLDDELAQDVDEKYNTMDDLKNSVKEKLNKNLEIRLRELKIEKLLEMIMENTPITLPESMIQAEIDSRWHRLARYYNTNAETLKQVMTPEGKDAEKENEWRTAATKALHGRFIIETLIEEQNIKVTDEDIEQELARIANENDLQIDDIRKNYQEEQALFYLKEEIKERRLTDILIAENTIKQGKKENYLDLMTDNA